MTVIPWVGDGMSRAFRILKQHHATCPNEDNIDTDVEMYDESLACTIGLM